MEKLKFLENEKAYEIFMGWRKELSKYTAARAALRRARTPLDVEQVGFYHALVRRLRDAGYEVNSYNRDRIAVAAALVSRIKTHSGKDTFAAQMSKQRNRRPLVSPMRLKRILAAEEYEDILRELTSAIRIMEERGNIADLAESMINWSDQARRNWLYRYYGNNDI
ncbi:MAG: type I-E CRISPR-associated protein Cse2/CasB [Syntrophales bacterium]